MAVLKTANWSAQTVTLHLTNLEELRSKMSVDNSTWTENIRGEPAQLLLQLLAFFDIEVGNNDGRAGNQSVRQPGIRHKIILLTQP